MKQSLSRTTRFNLHERRVRNGDRTVLRVQAYKTYTSCVWLYDSPRFCVAEPLWVKLPCLRLPICIPLHTPCNRKAAPKWCQVTRRIKLDCVFSCSPAFNGFISLLNILHRAHSVGIIQGGAAISRSLSTETEGFTGRSRLLMGNEENNYTSNALWTRHWLCDWLAVHCWENLQENNDFQGVCKKTSWKCLWAFRGVSLGRGACSFKEAFSSEDS